MPQSLQIEHNPRTVALLDQLPFLEIGNLALDALAGDIKDACDVALGEGKVEADLALVRTARAPFGEIGEHIGDLATKPRGCARFSGSQLAAYGVGEFAAKGFGNGTVAMIEVPEVPFVKHADATAHHRERAVIIGSARDHRGFRIAIARDIDSDQCFASVFVKPGQTDIAFDHLEDTGRVASGLGDNLARLNDAFGHPRQHGLAHRIGQSADPVLMRDDPLHRFWFLSPVGPDIA